MKISSKLHKQPGKFQFLVLDVFANEKPFFAAILIGDLRADPPESTDVSNECLRRLTAIQDLSSNNQAIHIVGIRSMEIVKTRILQVCNQVNRHDAVAFYCLDSKIYDAVFFELNIKS